MATGTYKTLGGGSFGRAPSGVSAVSTTSTSSSSSGLPPSASEDAEGNRLPNPPPGGYYTIAPSATVPGVGVTALVVATTAQPSASPPSGWSQWVFSGSGVPVPFWVSAYGPTAYTASGAVLGPLPLTYAAFVRYGLILPNEQYTPNAASTLETEEGTVNANTATVKQLQRELALATKLASNYTPLLQKAQSLQATAGSLFGQEEAAYTALVDPNGSVMTAVQSIENANGGSATLAQLQQIVALNNGLSNIESQSAIEQYGAGLFTTIPVTPAITAAIASCQSYLSIANQAIAAEKAANAAIAAATAAQQKVVLAGQAVYNFPVNAQDIDPSDFNSIVSTLQVFDVSNSPPEAGNNGPNIIQPHMAYVNTNILAYLNMAGGLPTAAWLGLGLFGAIVVLILIRNHG